MKLLKKSPLRLLALLPLFFLITKTKAQDRENKPLPTISPTVLWSLNEATGWVQASDGQWVSAKNKIKISTLPSTDPAQNTGSHAIGIDNFNAISARTVNVAGRELLLITKSMSVGDYKYGLREENFFQTPTTVFFVVNKNSAKYHLQMPGLDENLSGGPEYTMNLFYYGEVPTGPNTLKDIATKISEEAAQDPWISTSKLGTKDEVTLIYATVNGKPDACRFFMYESWNIDSNGHPARLLLPFNYNLGAGHFKWAYFELPTANLAGFIDLIKRK